MFTWEEAILFRRLLRFIGWFLLLIVAGGITLGLQSLLSSS